MAIPVDHLQRLGSGVILKSTKVVMDILTFGECALQRRPNRFCPHESRCRMDNNKVEVRLIFAAYGWPVHLFVGTSFSKRIIEDQNIEMVLESASKYGRSRGSG